jgi:hypothetical protein
MVHHRNALADMQDERRRSTCLADPDLGTHRKSMAKCQARCPHAVELQSLNGHTFPLTECLRSPISKGGVHLETLSARGATAQPDEVRFD